MIINNKMKTISIFFFIYFLFSTSHHCFGQLSPTAKDERHNFISSSSNKGNSIGEIYSQREQKSHTVKYMELYRNAVRKDGNYGYVGWELIYVDSDDIPELVLSGDCEASGSVLFSIYNGKIYKSYLSLGFSYIPYKNRVLDGRGMHMGIDSRAVEKLIQGKLVVILSVSMESNYSEDGEQSLTYRVNNKVTTEDDVDKVLEHNLFRYGELVECGGYSDNLRPMERFWR